MTNQAPITAEHAHHESRVPRGIAVPAALAALVAVVLAGCIASVARSGSPEPSANELGADGVSPSAVAGPTGPTPSPSFMRPTPTPAPTFLVYVVKTGESLNTIAHRFGTTGRSIAYWNRGTYPSLDPEAPSYKPNVIRIGWTLVLIPNVTVDEQTLPDPTPNPTDPSEAEPSPEPLPEPSPEPY